MWACGFSKKHIETYLFTDHETPVATKRETISCHARQDLYNTIDGREEGCVTYKPQ